MKLILAAILCFSATAFAATEFRQPVRNLVPTGTCHYGPNCQGPVLSQGVTKETCAYSGGHSLELDNGRACVSF